MKNNVIIRVLILGVIALTGIIAMQSYWIISTWDINEDEFDKKVNLALFNVAKDLATLNESTLPTRDIIKRKTSNYYIVNIESEIQEKTLEYLLAKEFEHLVLNIDFEYAVFNCSTDEMVYGNYCSYDPERKVPPEPGQFAKDKEFTYYFGVKFPTRSGYLFDKMQMTIFFSVILFFTTLFFGYSFFVILRQKRLSEMQKDFINNMTHEFKTPISTIKISADVFLNAPVIQGDERLLKYAGIIKKQNERLNRQVEKVLQINHIEKSGFELKKEEILLNECLTEIAENASVNIKEKGGDLAIHIPAEAIIIETDPLHFRNVIYNLLDNATKYCKDVPVIEMKLYREKGKTIIAIIDQGIGIDQEFLTKVLDKFYRIPTGNVHDVKGFGLGLYYVKSICNVQGWELKLSSEKGQGTTVELII